MARKAQSTESGAAWVNALGEMLGAQLGQAIAESMQRTLQQSISVSDLAARLGAGGGARRPGRPAKVAGATCSSPGCGKAVLAKGVCRSHYYKLRYKLQKEGKLVPKPRGSKRKAEASEKK